MHCSFDSHKKNILAQRITSRGEFLRWKVIYDGSDATP